MKKSHNILILLLFIFIKSNSQSIEEIITSDTDVFTDIAYKDNFIYIAGDGQGRIYKIDITDPSAGLLTVVENLSAPSGLVFNGDELFIAEFNGNKISKINVTDSTPTATTVTLTDGFNGPIGVAINGNYLYYSSSYDSIYKIDITEVSPAAELVLDGLSSVLDIEIINNELYFTTGFNISKINLSDSTPSAIIVVSGISDPIALGALGDNLYYSSGYDSISKMNVSNITNQPVSILTNLQSPYGIAFADECLYFTKIGSVLSRYCENLSINEYESQTNELFIHPTLFKDNITIRNLEKEVDFSIYNAAGLVILTDAVNADGIIDLSFLNSGLYFININNTKAFKIVKK